jgi:hypothetical protein
MKRASWPITILAVMFAAIANAGLVASTLEDLKGLTPLSISGVWLIPGIILLGTLLGVAIGDTARGAVALVVVALLSATLYGLAIAAPGFSVEGVQVTLIDRGTTAGLLAMMLIALFGLPGIVIAWLVETLVGGHDERLNDGPRTRVPFPARNHDTKG